MVNSKTFHKIALYIRVSTEEQASNPEGSIKSQEQRLRNHVTYQNQEGRFGEVVQVFIDRAKSAKNTKRPELQKLLRAVENKEVSLVMVTELSRLSRSLKDFCELRDMMRANDCEFQSLREQFDTTTAAGEMVLYTVANIAQFERRQISERVMANFTARAQRGLFNGGCVPLGFKLNPDRKGYLDIDPESAEIVREVYRTYLREGRLVATGKSLNERGIRMKQKKEGGGRNHRMGHFTVETLHKMITNKLYMGVKQYKVGNEWHESKAALEPIVDEVTWHAANKKLKKSAHVVKIGQKNRYPYFLYGLLFCGQCGERMCGKSANSKGRKIPYYEHTWSQKKQGCLPHKDYRCWPFRVLCKIIEPAVWNEALKLLQERERAETLIKKIKGIHRAKGSDEELNKMRAKKLALEQQLDALAEHLTTIPKGVNPGPIYLQMEKLETQKTEIEALIEKHLQDQKELPVELTNYQLFLQGLLEISTHGDNHEIKRKIIETLIHKIVIHQDGLEIFYFVGDGVITERAENTKPAGISSDAGSNSLKIGWVTRFHPNLLIFLTS